MKQKEMIDINVNFEEENSFKTPKKESVFQMIIVACLRHQQLNNGAHPRIDLPSLKTKKTRIAIEEVNEGLIIFHPLPVL